MTKRFFLILSLITLTFFSGKAQLNLASCKSEVNFRSGPGLNYKVEHTINQSNLLVILPSESKNGFVQVFDVETGSLGYVYQSLIQLTDTLLPNKQLFFELANKNEKGELEIVLINRTQKQLFLWLNAQTYHISPFEKKVLILPDEQLTYFCSVPGAFPIYGKEKLKKGNSYHWNFSL